MYCVAAHPSASPLPRRVQAVGGILPRPILGGLHHHVRICDRDRMEFAVGTAELVLPVPCPLPKNRANRGHLDVNLAIYNSGARAILPAGS